jgi:hypothetical protein
VAIPVCSDMDFGGVARLKNLTSPVEDNDAARMVDVVRATGALCWKAPCRVATTASIDVGDPGSTIDGVALAVGDRVLVKDQLSPRENGIYIWNGAGSSMTRAPDADTTEKLLGAVVTVLEGTFNAGTTWRQQTGTVDPDGTLIVWKRFTTVPEIPGVWTAESQSTGATKSANVAFVAPLQIPGVIVPINGVIRFVVRVTTALGAAGTIGLYDASGARVLKSADGAISTAVGLKSVSVDVPQGFMLGPGTFYVALTWNSATGAVSAADPNGIIQRCGTITLSNPSTLPATINLGNIVNGYMLIAYVGAT